MTHATLPDARAAGGLGIDAGLAALTPLQQMFFGFLADYSGATRDLYEYHLNRYMTWCEHNGVDPLNASRTTVALYVRHLADECGLRASSVNTSMTPVRGMYKWACVEGLLDRDPVAHVRLPKSDHRQKSPLDREELRRLRAAGKQLGGRHWALSELLIVHALRISEACGIQIPNYQDTERGHRVLRYRRKGGAWRTVPMPAPVIMALDDAAGDRTTGPVIRTLAGGPLSRSAGAGLLNTIVKRAQLGKPVNPHLVRASVVTVHLDGGGDIREAQRLADHQDPRTTSKHYDLSRTNPDTHPSHIVSARLMV